MEFEVAVKDGKAILRPIVKSGREVGPSKRPTAARVQCAGQWVSARLDGGGAASEGRRLEAGGILEIRRRDGIAAVTVVAPCWNPAGQLHKIISRRRPRCPR